MDAYYSRRSFLSIATATAASMSVAGVATQASATTRSPAALGPIQQINAGPLNVGYADIGPREGKPVVLFHGWPYDIHSFDDVAQQLSSKGFRVIVPYLRGYGSTRFLSDTTMRSAQQTALASDAVALMDALGIESAIVGGFDWGARNACVLAALWPQRCKALVSVSGFLVINRAAGSLPLAPADELAWWYQFYLATERGRAGYAKNLKEFARLIWHQASPKWKFDDAAFDRSAAGLVNPDHVELVVHNYRWRIGLVEGDPQYDALEEKLTTIQTVSLPTITLEGDANGASHPPPAAYARRFMGKYEHRELRGGIGHNLPQEAPSAFAKAIVDVDHWSSVG